MTFQGCLVVQHPGTPNSEARKENTGPANRSSVDSIAASGGWEIIVGDQSERLAATVPPSELAVCATLLAKTAGVKKLHVVIAPASTSCFFVKLKPSDDIDIRDRSALTYELEDHLPIDAESMAADFVAIESPSDEAGTVGALAIPVHPWKSVVDAFESADLPVRSIVPAAVLAVRALSSGGDLAETVRWLLVDGSRCDCLCVRNETILSWHHVAADAGALRPLLMLDHSNADRTVVLGADPQQVESIRQIQGDVDVDSASAGAFVADGAQLLLDNRSQRWFDLRKDALGPTDPLRAIGAQLRWVGLAAALCFFVLAIGGWWRANRIESEIAATRDLQTDLFRETFPGTRVPGAVLRRVRSEHTRVANSRGQNLDVKIPPPATVVLYELLAALPDDIRYRIEEIDIQKGNVQMTVLVKASGDVTTIVDAIAARGFSVQSPGFRRSDDNENEWTVPINATWVGRQTSDEASS
tara:strand:+ start:1015032 stop:1016444 length:1413 start_codon:yes stop_codon:yes gene_type:complete